MLFPANATYLIVWDTLSCLIVSFGFCKDLNVLIRKIFNPSGKQIINGHIWECYIQIRPAKKYFILTSKKSQQF